jgi:uncharacterized damage-inducible protein DinB
MTTQSGIEDTALQALCIRITKVLPTQIRSCLDQLSDEQIWWRPNEQANSVGNLTLHICGAVMHFLCRGVGGHDYLRNRPTEFATQRLPRSELLKTFDTMVDEAEQTFARMNASRLREESTEPTYYSTVFEDLFGVAIHMAVHTGQIVYVTKMLKEGSINDLWTQTHNTTGAWRS